MPVKMNFKERKMVTIMTTNKSKSARSICQNKRQLGFTLVEMAIVMMIVGLVIGSVAQLYKQRIAYIQDQDTKENVRDDVTAAINNFVDTYGRYPCPASLTAARGSATYGRESADDCDPGNNLTIAANGIETVAGLNAARVRIGAVPFLELNLREQDTIDGYGNRIIYAVSENLTRQTTFDPDFGQIELLDENRNAITDGAGVPYAHYIVFSTGKNAEGAFSAAGAGGANTCDVLAINGEGENCDYDDATFITAPLSQGENANDNDDIIAYSNAIARWQTPEEDPAGPPVGVDPNDIVTSDDTLVGFGVGIADNPEEEIDIAGVVRAQDDPYTTSIEEGAILSDNICSHGSIAAGTPNCFASSLIGGEDALMACPAGQYMVGIENGKIQCKDEFIQACPPGYIMEGFNSDGSIKCDDLPLRCAGEPVDICGETRTLRSDAVEGDFDTVSAGVAGNPKRITYQCRNGAWERYSETGLCSCATDVLRTQTKSCGQSSHCGSRFSGTYERELVRSCPSGKLGWQTTSSACSCIESVRTWSGGCPSGFTQGRTYYKREHNCTTKKCGPTITTHNTCKCKPFRNERARWCPSGMTGKYKQERFFDCHNGEDKKGKWRFGNSGYKDVPGNGYAENCVCKPSTSTVKKSCPVGQIGDAWQKIDYVCDFADKPPRKVTNPIDYSGCSVPPPVVCRWDNFQGNGETASAGVGKTHKGECDCDAEKGDVKLCSKGINPTKFELGVCTCQ